MLKGVRLGKWERLVLKIGAEAKAQGEEWATLNGRHYLVVDWVAIRRSFHRVQELGLVESLGTLFSRLFRGPLGSGFGEWSKEFREEYERLHRIRCRYRTTLIFKRYGNTHGMDYNPIIFRFTDNGQRLWDEYGPAIASGERIRWGKPPAKV